VLRYAAQTDDVVMAPERSGQRSSGRLLAAAAAVLVALVGGYQLGHREAGANSSGAPAPTRVLSVDWQSVPEEGGR